MSGKRYSAQSRLDKYKAVDASQSTLNVNAQEFVPAFRSSYEAEVDNDSEDIEMFTSACLREIAEHPGDFNIIVPTFMGEFHDYLTSTTTTIKFAITIAELCISNPNCRFHGVMLANLMHRQSHDFLKAMISYCKDNLVKVTTSSTNVDSVVNYLFFVGELYVQFQEHNRRMKDLQLLVIDICNSLRREGDESSLLALIKFLKLVGQSLYQDNRSELNGVMSYLESVSKASDCGERLRSCIRVLIQTHKDKWYLDPELQIQDPCEDGLDEVENSVLYGPDGQEISSEENTFLLSCCDDRKGSNIT